MLNIKTLNGNIFISGDTYPIKDQLKELPACRWHKASKSYVMPATVGAVRNCIPIIGTLPMSLPVDVGFRNLLSFMQYQDAAQAVKQHACTAACPAWHHQGEAISFIKNQPAAILNMPTGTGKTKTTIDLIVERAHQFVLVITKKKAVSVWKKDVKKFLGDDAMNVVQLDTGSVQKNLKIAKEAVQDTSKPLVLVINYQSIWRNPFKSWILSQPIDLLVLDESHVIKAPGGKASIFLKNLRKRVASVIALTATFFGDKPIDIYGQMRTIDPAVYGTSFAKFKDEYCFIGGYSGREILGYKNQQQMMDKIALYIYQVDKVVLNLIPVRHKTYYCKLDEKLMKIYRQFDKECFVSLGDDKCISADNILVRLLKSQQIACGFIQPDDSDEIIRLDTSKLDTLTEILEGLPEAENVPEHSPVVVYCRFKEDLKGIRAVAEKLGYVYGEISGNIDQQELFKTGGCNLLGCQISAGGTGVDGLQDVSHIGIYYSTGYSLTEFEQSLGRQDRPGQKESVLYIYIVAENTIDEEIVKALQSKKDVIKALEEKLKTIAKSAT
jgi:SNF2 family DNA or RNA helicase